MLLVIFGSDHHRANLLRNGALFIDHFQIAKTLKADLSVNEVIFCSYNNGKRLCSYFQF